MRSGVPLSPDLMSATPRDGRWFTLAARFFPGICNALAASGDNAPPGLGRDGKIGDMGSFAVISGDHASAL